MSQTKYNPRTELNEEQIKFGDYLNNEKLQKEQLEFIEEKQRAKDNSCRIMEEEFIIKEKESQ